MKYTIGDVSKILNIPISTIRYYDNQGLLPFIERKDSGYRQFSKTDIAMLELIECLKKTGMSIKDIKQFGEWVKAGDASLFQRYHMFLERKEAVLQQMEELEKSLQVIEFKCNYYKVALEAGTEDVHIKKHVEVKKKVH